VISKRFSKTWTVLAELMYQLNQQSLAPAR